MIVLPWVVACSATSLPIGEVFTSNTCHINEEGVSLISDKKELVNTIKRLHYGSVGKENYVIPTVNFDEYNVYIISMGRKRTAGYAIQLTDQNADYRHGVVDLPVKLITPSQKGVLAQVITSPCKIITLPKGDYKQVKM